MIKVEILLERSTTVIVHEDVVASFAGDKGVCHIFVLEDGTTFSYPYRNMSYMKVAGVHGLNY